MADGCSRGNLVISPLPLPHLNLSLDDFTAGDISKDEIHFCAST